MVPQHRAERSALHWTLGALGLALGTIPGCAAGPGGRVDEGPHPLWPPGAQKTRIVHRQSLRSSSQMARPGFFNAIVEAIAGSRHQQFLRPQSIAAGDGRLYVVDQELQGIHVLRTGSNKARFIERVDKTTYFVSPVGIAWCHGSIAVSDSGLNQVFILDPEGKLIRVLEKPGGFARPTGLAYDPQRRVLYVVDTLAGEVCVFDAAGAFVRRIGGPGSLAGEFHFPTYAAVDAWGRIYVTDSLNFRVQVFSPWGHFIFEIGELGNASGYLAVPKGIGVDSFGHIYVVDSYFSAVQIFNQRGQLLLSFGDVGDANGEFQVPTGLLVTPDNRIYICDSQNSRVQVFDYVGGPDDEP